MKKTIIAITVAFILSTAGLAQGPTVLANFDFNENSSLPQNANTTASNITASINGTESDASYNGTATGSNAFVQNTTAGNAMSMSGNTNTNTWTLTMGGSNLYLYGSYKLYFQAQRSNTGATTITLSYSTDGTNFTNVSTTASPGNGSFAEATIDMSSITAINNASALYIKFSGSGSTNSGGTLRMDNLEIEGTETSSGTNGNNTFFNGNVGIGTNNPAYPLDVVGAARISGATTVGSLSSGNVTSSGNLSVSGTTNLTGAVTMGVLTSGATTVSSLTNNGNLSVTGTTNLTGAVTTGALTSGATTVNSLNVSSLTGSSNRMAVLNSSGNIIAGGTIGQTLSSPWNIGGNTNGGLFTLGTMDGYDLPFIAGGTTGTPASVERMRLTSGGLFGIGTPNPYALLHINTQNTGATPGLIVDNANPVEGPQEFVVNSDGSMVINDNIPTNGDILSINTQLDSDPSHGTDNYVVNLFRVSNTIGGGTKVGIGTGKPADVSNPGYSLNPVSAYKMLTVNGDVSFANYNNSGSGNTTDGFTALEILGNNQVPTRRGITVDNDPSGDFNFYINSNQGSADFHFKNGNPSATQTELMKIDEFGGVTIPKLPNPTLAAGSYNNVLVDNTGKLVYGATVGTTSSAAWVLGGNSGTGTNNIIGTTDTDLKFIAGNGNIMTLSQSGTLSLYPENGNSGVSGSAFKIISPSNSPNWAPFEVLSNGTTYIGPQRPTQSPFNSALLNVAGTMVAQEIWVSVTEAGWSDYVFDKNYKLLPLKEVETYYKENHHLPNIPSANEMERSGNNLGKTDAVLLQKIEELTIYIVQQQKLLENQQQRITELEKQIKK